MLSSKLWQTPLAIVTSIGVTPDDDDETRLQKAILVGTTLMVSVAAALWGLVYLLIGEPVAASIPLLYAVFSLAYIAILGITFRFRFFRFAQFMLTVLLPFLLMLALGGYINGSAVIFWAFLAPIGALLGGQWRQALHWFLA